MAMLVLLHEGLTLKRIPLKEKQIVIGRKADADIFLDDKMVSHEHARIVSADPPEKEGGAHYYIEDMDSTNGTFVNGETITRVFLSHEDNIRIGKHIFKFVDETAVQEDKTTKLHKSWIPGVYYTKEEKGK
jgi:pSer/pThr/pTyr-binding forkhead associated (FHA) protein